MEVAGMLGTLAKSLLGNNNSVKYVIDKDHSTVAVSDTLQLLQHLDIEHPIGDVIYQACNSHHSVHGTGTKTLLSLIGIWTKSAIRLQDMGVPVPEIINLMHSGIDQCLKQMEVMKIPVDIKTQTINDSHQKHSPLGQVNKSNDTEGEEMCFRENSSNVYKQQQQTCQPSGVEPSSSSKQNALLTKSSTHFDNELKYSMTLEQQQCVKPAAVCQFPNHDGNESSASDGLSAESHLDVNFNSNAQHFENFKTNSPPSVDKIAEFSSKVPSNSEPPDFQQRIFPFNLPQNNFHILGKDFQSNEFNYPETNAEGFDNNIKSSHDDSADCSSEDEFADCFADIGDKFVETSEGKSDNKNDETVFFKQDMNKDNCKNSFCDDLEASVKKKQSAVVSLNLKMEMAADDEDDDDISWFFSENSDECSNKQTVTSLMHPDVVEQLTGFEAQDNIDISKIFPERDFIKTKEVTTKINKVCKNSTLPDLSCQLATATETVDTKQKNEDQSKHLPVNHCEETLSSVQSTFYAANDHADQLPNSVNTNNLNEEIKNCKPLTLCPSIKTDAETKNGSAKDQIKNLNSLLARMKPISVTKVQNCSRHFKTIESSVDVHHNATNYALRIKPLITNQQLREDKQKYTTEGFCGGSHGLTTQAEIGGNFSNTTNGASGEIHTSTMQDIVLNNLGHKSEEMNTKYSSRLTEMCNESALHCTTESAGSSSIQDKKVSYGCQQNTPNESSRISDIFTLASGLSHGRLRAMSLVLEVLSHQQKCRSQPETNLQFDLSRLHTSIEVGLSEERSCVVEGLILNLSAEQTPLIHSWTDTAIPSLLINGSIQPTFKHKGYKPPVKVKSRFTNAGSRAPETWTERIKSRVLNLGVKLLLLTGSCDDDLRLELECNGVLVAEAMKYNLLAVAAGSNSWQILTYLDEASQEDVCYLRLGPMKTSSTNQLARNIVLKPFDKEPFWTILLCHPSRDVARIREQEVCKCAQALSSALSSGFVLPGGGQTEKILADFLIISEEHQHSDVKNIFQQLVFEELARGLLEYHAIVDANVDISRQTDGETFVKNNSDKFCRPPFEHNSKHEEEKCGFFGANIYNKQATSNTCFKNRNIDTDLNNGPKDYLDQFENRSLLTHTFNDTDNLVAEACETCQHSYCSISGDKAGVMKSENTVWSGAVDNPLTQEQCSTTHCEHLSEIPQPRNDRAFYKDTGKTELDTLPLLDGNSVKPFKEFTRAAKIMCTPCGLSHDLNSVTNVSSLDGFVAKQSVFSTAIETVGLLLQCDRHITTGITSDTIYSNLL